MNSSRLIIFALICWAVFFIFFIRDRSRYRNTAFLFIAMAATLPALCSLTGDRAPRVFFYCIIVICFVILIVPVFLIHNGIVMWRREGHGLTNTLSMLLGIVILLGEISTLVYFLWTVNNTSTSRLATILSHVALPSFLLSFTVIYGSVVFLMFMFYSIFLMIIPRRRDFDYVIIHGAGLLNGNRVSKLLADRIDKAIEIYRKDPTPPYLIPSGGQGSDETVSEAEAMAGYLKEHGIPEDKIILEDRSATTMENLANCKAIIDSREGRKYTTLVTSNYHVYRALRYCRKIGLKCTGVGSHVALYYWPSALIREFIAIHREKKHLLLFIGGWLSWMVIILLAAGWM